MSEYAVTKKFEKIQKDISAKLDAGHDFNFCSGYLSGLLNNSEDITTTKISFDDFKKLQNFLIGKWVLKFFGMKY